MKKLLIITVALLFAMSAPAFAAKAVLSDEEMSDINAGDWVVLNPGSGNESVEDVYINNNTLDLDATVQQELMAVSNANAVDSAIAVSSNIAKISGTDPSLSQAVAQGNEADVSQHRAKDVTTETCLNEVSSIEACEESSSLEKTESCLIVSSKECETSSSKSFSYDEDLEIEYDKDTVGLLVIDAEEEEKGEESEFNLSGSLVIEEEFDLDYDKDITCEESSESSKEECFLLEKNETCKFTESKSHLSANCEKTEKTRIEEKCCGTNNHLDLTDSAQMNLKAVSNLNAVASGAAVQANIASNLGVSGSITQWNSATVGSGL